MDHWLKNDKTKRAGSQGRKPPQYSYKKHALIIDKFLRVKSFRKSHVTFWMLSKNKIPFSFVWEKILDIFYNLKYCNIWQIFFRPCKTSLKITLHCVYMDWNTSNVAGDYEVIRFLICTEFSV